MIDRATSDLIATLAYTARASQENLAVALKDACPGPHKYVQHRDHKPPWCNACGYAANGDQIKNVSVDRFWIVDDINTHDDNGPEEWLASGDLVGIVDNVAGGIVAYCHKDTAQRIITVLDRTPDW